MFEHIAYESILQRMLDRVSDKLDKREGSIIWDALAPAAIELQLMYIELDRVLAETFADTASREHLILRAAERPLYPEPATHVVLRGRFDVSVAIGARFSLEDLNYVVLSRREDGDYELQCETPGRDGNRLLGALIPIEYIQGLTSAELLEVITPGEDEEDTEAFRQRYLEDLEGGAFGGNITDYKKKVKAIDGVGGVKVYPVWNGGGTVRLVVIDSEYNPPTPVFLDKVQTAIDPIPNQGQGLGIAPIGHFVTVQGAAERDVGITSRLVFKTGYSWEQLKPAIEEQVEAYFAELRMGWEAEDYLIVRISQIETRILSIEGVLDVGDTTLNSQAGNLALGADEIPVRGEIIVT